MEARQHHKRTAFFITTPALLDSGADFSVITTEIFENLKPLRAGAVYAEDFKGEGDVSLLYSPDIEIHENTFLAEREQRA